MDIVVTYDICTTDARGPQRLARIAKVCESFGVRAQFSVFECRLDERMRAELITQLLEIMEPQLDSVNLYQLNASIADARTTLGNGGQGTAERHWIV